MPKPEPRRIDYPTDSYPEAYVVLPGEWVGHHLQRRNDVLASVPDKTPNEIIQVSVALAVADEWGGIPGISGSDPEKWDFSKTPIALIAWLTSVVLTDFGKALTVPKAPSPLSGTTTGTAEKKQNTAGSSGTTE